MNANDIILWLLVAAVAFMVGQGRIWRTPQPLLDTISQDRLSEWQRNDAGTIRVYRRCIHARLLRCYNLEELRTLAFDIGLQHEDIRGDTPNEYAMELLTFCERRGFLSYLLDAMR